MSKTYRINEIFYSLQGEGVRAGTPNVFIRFTGCNLRCSMEAGPKSPGGFDCDTEFESGRSLTLDEIAEWVGKAIEQVVDWKSPDTLHQETNVKWKEPWIILTGGEPGLQVNEDFCAYFHDKGFKLAIETNGTVDIGGTLGHGCRVGVDWITCSPKVAEHAVKCRLVDELKYVRGYGQGIPKPVATAKHYLISPAFDGMEVHKETLKWCTKLCLENPPWRLSLQTHKLLMVR